MMEAAEQDAVGRAGGAARAAGHDVVQVARGGGLVAAGGGAVLVPGDDGAAQVRRDEVGDRADVQGQADRRGGPGQGAGAEPGRQAARPRQQGDGVGQDQLAGAAAGQLAAGAVGAAAAGAAARLGGAAARPGAGGGGGGRAGGGGLGR